MTDIERTLDRLRGRLSRAGARPLRRPPDTVELDELIAAIAPMRLPEAVETWWRLVDVSSFPMQPFPRPCRPDRALRTWTSYQEEFVGVVPRCLVPVASDSAGILSVDVDATDSRGGDVVGWAVDDGGMFEHVASSWIDVLECYVDVIDAGAFELRRGVVMPELEILEGALRARRSDTVLPPRYPARTMRFATPADWPLHWQRATGIRPGDRQPRGRTLTIGEILAAPLGTRLRGTIVGRVVGLVGSAGGALASVDDRSGRLDVWCPAAACTWGPRLEGIFEFDVEARTDGQRDVATTTVAVTATAIRPAA